jgi:asparagine synthase (glutamine-hydrolysing)
MGYTRAEKIAGRRKIEGTREVCGIAGIWGDGLNQPLELLIDRMSAQIAHRGPDDSGRWVDPHRQVALGHRRLAIQDLSAAGHQPMTSASGRFVLVLNGEIYNHLELRRDYEQECGPVSWRGHSDTETLLALFEQLGLEATLRRCVGMFAIALWDRERRTLMLARDRIGEKPLYFGRIASSILFASELKSIRSVLGERCEVDREALTLFMRHNYVPAPRTIYRHISKLEPGTIATFHSPVAEPLTTTYWSAREAARSGIKNPFTGSDEDAVERLDQVLGRAVQSQLISDVPLGAFLSGGIDSSLVVAMMQAKGRTQARTFTIGFHEQQFDEAKYAREVARHLGTDHTEHYVTPQEALSVIPALPQMYDEPFADSSQIPTFLVSRVARQKVTVTLSGDAGDELFGGYTRYLWTGRLAKVLSLIPRAVRKPVVRVFRARGENPSPKAIVRGPQSAHIPRMARLRSKVNKVLDLLDVDSAADVYHGLVSHWKDPASVVVGGGEPLTRVANPAEWLGHGGIEMHMMYLDLITYLPDDILVKVDRASMSVALESRVPMLDHRVIEFAWSLPMNLKIRDGKGKWIMRQLLQRYVPPKLFDREKTGFGIPIDSWLRGPLREWASTLLDTRRLADEGYFQPAPIRAYWEQHIAGTRNWGYYLWDVLMFQAWLEHNRNPASIRTAA